MGLIMEIIQNRKYSYFFDSLRWGIIVSIINVLFYFNNELYIILSGFIKKQDKTNPSEIKKALKIQRQYIDEKEKRNEDGIILEDKNDESK
jgi:hypothetical protein